MGGGVPVGPQTSLYSYRMSDREPTEKPPVVACFCSNFLKPDMRHIYRQISSLQRVRPVVFTQNREMAMRILRARLLQLHEEERRKELDDLKGEHVDAGWGNQIRSYVLHPYQMVKDHRTDQETGNVQAVLDGNLDPFMEAYLRHTIGAN